MVVAIVSGLPTHSVAQQSPRPDQYNHDHISLQLCTALKQNFAGFHNITESTFVSFTLKTLC